ncbi:hypothetical protein ACVIYH_005097 [Bradyrhizobium diazoefficiens]
MGWRSRGQNPRCGRRRAATGLTGPGGSRQGPRSLAVIFQMSRRAHFKTFVDPLFLRRRAILQRSVVIGLRAIDVRLIACRTATGCRPDRVGCLARGVGSSARPVLVADVARFAGIAGFYAFIRFSLHALSNTGLGLWLRLLGVSSYRYDWKCEKQCHRQVSHGCSPSRPRRFINVRIPEHFRQTNENLRLHR